MKPGRPPDPRTMSQRTSIEMEASTGSAASSEVAGETMGRVVLAHQLDLGPSEREPVAEGLLECLETFVQTCVGASDAGQHLLHELLVEGDLPIDADLAGGNHVVMHLLEHAESERRDRPERVPHAEQHFFIRLAL